MMNNKGQTLVLFVVLIPILLLLAAFVIDTGLIINAEIKLKSTTKIALQESKGVDNKEEIIIELLKKNNIKVDNLEMKIIDNKIKIKNNYYIDSMFGSIIGIKRYNIKVNMSAVYEGDKVIIKEE